MNEINESIKELEEEIAEKQNLITFLKNFETMDFTEDNYHKLCESPLRGNRIIGKRIEKVFPFLKLSDYKGFNNYIFSLEINGKDYEVLIPCYSYHTIEIIIPRPSDIKIADNDLRIINERLARIEKALNAKNIFDRANCVEEHYKKPFRILAYLINHKNKKNYTERLTAIKEDLKKQQISAIKKIEEIEKQHKEYEEIIKTLTKVYVPQLLTWTEKVVVKGSQTSWDKALIIKREEKEE